MHERKDDVHLQNCYSKGGNAWDKQQLEYELRNNLLLSKPDELLGKY